MDLIENKVRVDEGFIDVKCRKGEVCCCYYTSYSTSLIISQLVIYIFLYHITCIATRMNDLSRTQIISDNKYLQVDWL